MGTLDYIILAMVAVSALIALRSCRRARKNGCSGNCAFCTRGCGK